MSDDTAPLHIWRHIINKLKWVRIHRITPSYGRTYQTIFLFIVKHKSFKLDKSRNTEWNIRVTSKWQWKRAQLMVKMLFCIFHYEMSYIFEQFFAAMFFISKSTRCCRGVALCVFSLFQLKIFNRLKFIATHLLAFLGAEKIVREIGSVFISVDFVRSDKLKWNFSSFVCPLNIAWISEIIEIIRNNLFIAVPISNPTTRFQVQLCGHACIISYRKLKIR